MTLRSSRNSLLVAVLMFAVILAGCFGSQEDDPEQEGLDDATPAEGGNDYDRSEVNNRTARATVNGKNSTADPREPEWPPLESAPIRPGSNIDGCTTNFVFWDPVNDTVYMGTAAHCVQRLNIGDNVTIFEGEFPAIIGGNTGVTAEGTLAYSGWWTGSGHDSDYGEDFALIKINEDDRDKVHPKMLYYGGPTGIATSLDVEPLDRVLWYGNSNFRQHYDDFHPNEGYICELGDSFGERLQFYPVGPTVQGDSGAPIVVAEDGRALALATNISPVSSSCLSTSAAGPWLYLAFEEANERGMNVELATWPLENEGRLPDLPT